MNTAAKVVLVTGGAVRVGRAIALEFAHAGWALAFTYRSSAAAARELEAELGAAGTPALAIAADLADHGARALVAERVQASSAASTPWSTARPSSRAHRLRTSPPPSSRTRCGPTSRRRCS